MSENKFNGDIEKYLPAIRRIAQRYAKEDVHGLGRDLEQEGVIGVLSATRFTGDDPDKERGYYLLKAKYAIIDALRRLAQPRAVCRARKALQVADEAVGVEGGAQRRAKALGVTLERYETLRLLAANTESEISEGDISTGSDAQIYIDTVLSLGAPAILKALTERDRQILSWRINDGLFAGDIGAILGVTESRVIQLLAQIRKKMRKKGWK